jgi:hypothetical protein
MTGQGSESSDENMAVSRFHAPGSIQTTESSISLMIRTAAAPLAGTVTYYLVFN